MLGQEGFVDIQVLHRQGVSIKGIARELGVSRNTVRVRRSSSPSRGLARRGWHSRSDGACIRSGHTGGEDGPPS